MRGAIPLHAFTHDERGNDHDGEDDFMMRELHRGKRSSELKMERERDGSAAPKWRPNPLVSERCREVFSEGLMTRSR